MTELWNVIRNFFTKKHIVYYICFIILYRFAEGFVMKIVPLFLKAGRDVGGLGLTEQEIGIYYGTFGAAAFVLGSLLGGYYISARGLKRLCSPCVVCSICLLWLTRCLPFSNRRVRPLSEGPLCWSISDMVSALWGLPCS